MRVIRHCDGQCGHGQDEDEHNEKSQAARHAEGGAFRKRVGHGLQSFLNKRYHGSRGDGNSSALFL
jgi:hypothetical protein